MPKVSVVIPTHNRDHVLARAIDSVLRQTFDDFEVIVVDDGSTDSTPSVVKEYADNRIVYHRIEDRSGASKARNLGIRLASTPYIAFLDSDDEYHPDYLDRQLAYFNKQDSRVALLFTATREVRQGGYEAYNEINTEEVAGGDIVAGNPIGGLSGTIFRRDILRRHQIDTALPTAEDYDLFVRVLHDGYLARGIDEPLVTVYKDRSDRLSDSLEAKIRGIETVLDKHRNKLLPRSQSDLHYQLGIRYAEHGDLKAARSRFFRSSKLHWKNWRALLHGIAALHPSPYRIFIRFKRTLKSI